MYVSLYVSSKYIKDFASKKGEAVAISLSSSLPLSSTFNFRRIQPRNEDGHPRISRFRFSSWWRNARRGEKFSPPPSGVRVSRWMIRLRRDCGWLCGGGEGDETRRRRTWGRLLDRGVFPRMLCNPISQFYELAGFDRTDWIFQLDVRWNRGRGGEVYGCKGKFYFAF